MAKAAAKTEKPLTKVQIFTNIAEATGLSKKQIAEVFEALKAEIASSVGKKGVGSFVIPDLCKIVRIQKKALPKRQVRNPQTGEMKWADPKPASTAVKVLRSEEAQRHGLIPRPSFDKTKRLGQAFELAHFR